MSAWPKQRRIPHREAVKLALLGLALLFGMETLAIYHLYIEQKDVMGASLIIIGWFKEGIWAVVEHFV